MRLIRILVATVVCLTPGVGVFADEPGLDDGSGWTMIRLDLDIAVIAEEPSIFVEGEMTLRLDAERSLGPTLWLNTTQPGMEWRSLTGEGVAETNINQAHRGSGARRLAKTRLKTTAGRGDEITLSFAAEQIGDSELLISRPDFALASWVEGWYPVTLNGMGTGAALAEIISIPGTTTFDLPLGWVAMTDGRRVNRDHRDGRSWEVWESSEDPQARSFAVGAYRTAEREVDGRMIRIYLMNDHIFGAEMLAEMLTASLEAQEARFGPFPSSGYGVVEVPTGGQWNAASQQSFIMAKSWNFDFKEGKLPLWAHEMSHGWWGNRVGTTGFATKMVGEALAQFGAVVSIEALEGSDAMIEFLEFSRRDWSDRQCARGYFRLAEQGFDRPLSTLNFSGLSGNLSHNLVNSKGLWIYHMLRRRVGDEKFFQTLRTLIDDYAGRRLSLAEVRMAFILAAPDHDLEDFFAQWLDRIGAPRIETNWSMLDADRALVTLRQPGDGKPFTLDLEVELVFGDGSTQRNRLHVSGRETEVIWLVPNEITEIRLDPDRDHLLWRAAYDLPPSVDGIRLTESAPWLDASIYEGTYRIDLFESNSEVFGNAAGLFIKLGADARRLYPDIEHRFATYSATVDFEVVDGKAVALTYQMASGRVARGVRIE